jgi:hypothetical protein
MMPNEMKAAIAGMDTTEQAAWMKANLDKLMRMANRMLEPGTEEAQWARDNARQEDLDWVRAHGDPCINDGDLRWKWDAHVGLRVAITVVKVIRQPDGRRHYDVLRNGKLEVWSAQMMEGDTEPDDDNG